MPKTGFLVKQLICDMVNQFIIIWSLGISLVCYMQNCILTITVLKPAYLQMMFTYKPNDNIAKRNESN